MRRSAVAFGQFLLLLLAIGGAVLLIEVKKEDVQIGAVVTESDKVKVVEEQVVEEVKEQEVIEQKININTAGLTELQQITGVGPVIAQRIIDYRTEFGLFRVVEDIKNVKGIGEKTFEKMKDQIVAF